MKQDKEDSVEKGETPESWKSWEEYSKGLEVPPNPHAYAAGYNSAKEKYQQEIRQLQEEVKTAKSDYKYLHDRYCHYYDKCGQLESELSAAKEKHSQTWDAALESLGTIHKRRNGDKFMPKEQAKFIASLMEKDLEEAKSTYLNNLFENKKDSK
jgi:predicted  nucleic acid-binding Zn-ribbon protein